MSEPADPRPRPVVFVDDEPDQIETFRLNFRRDFDLHLVDSGQKALELLAELKASGREAAVLLTDQRMPGLSGVEVLAQAKEQSPDTVRMVVTAYKDAESILDAVNKGDVYRYVVKPWNVEEMRITIRNAIERFELVKDNQRLVQRLKDVNAYLEGELDRAFPALDEIVGAEGGLKTTIDAVKSVAETKSTVLLRGETGTGKELIARVIHQLSPRASKRLVALNCAALTDTLLESELFGHEKGAFTGADRRKPGRFELADGGTLFLDEIGDVSPALQTKLLRVLQEREFERVGGTETIKVDVRVIAATHQNLEQLVNEGKFRQDLYYRLNVFPIELPPLRERREDIAGLAEFFLRRHAQENGRLHLRGFEPGARARLVEYAWPGNVRELENVIERAVIVQTGGSEITADVISFLDLNVAPPPPTSPVRRPGDIGVSDSAPLPDLLERTEHDELVRAMEESKGSKAAAARSLGINRSTLYYRLRKHGLATRYGLPPE